MPRRLDPRIAVGERAKKEPLWVPKYSESASEADASRSTAAQAGLGRPSDISSHVCPLSRVR